MRCSTPGHPHWAACTPRQIAELPLNGRSFLQLATLQPGVIMSRGTAPRIHGRLWQHTALDCRRRPEHTGYLLDGTNIADISDKAPSSLAGVILGVDTDSASSASRRTATAPNSDAPPAGSSAPSQSPGPTSSTGRSSGSIATARSTPAISSIRGPPPRSCANQFGGTLGGPLRPESGVLFRGLRRAARPPGGDANRQAARTRSHTRACCRTRAAGCRSVRFTRCASRIWICSSRFLRGDFGDGTAE